MLRSTSLLQRSLRSFQPYYRSITNTNFERNELGIKHLDDLPTAKKFLGLVDLQLLRWPMTKFHEFFGNRREKLGDMFMFQPFFFSPKMVVISTPDLLSELCAKEGKLPSRGIYSSDYLKAKEIVGLKQGIAFIEDEEWKRIRDPLSKRLLRPKFLSGYFPKLSEIAKAALTDIIQMKQTHKDDLTPIVERLCLWTINSADYLSFHKLTDNELNTEMREYFQAIMNIVASFSDVHVKKISEIFSNKKRDKIVDSLYTAIKYNKKYIDSADTSPKDPDREQITLLEYLRTETDFDEKEIIDVLMTLLTAGVDTTTKTVQWLWYNLSKHPNVQDKLHDELHSVIRDSSVITAEHYNKLHYMKMCFKESMRVTPSVSAHSRVMKEDTIIRGVLLPKKTSVLVDLFGMLLDERFWDNPLEFKPERWENRKEIDPFSFAQFGIGPRMCVGRRIAEAEMQLITAHLCMSYKIHLEKESDAKFDAIMRPEGLNLSFEKRH